MGQTFGRLTVIDEGISRKDRVYYLCRCECGRTSRVSASALKGGRTKSCGCLRAYITAERIKQQNTTHGAKSSVRTNKQRCIYESWCSMKQRCFSPDATGFKHWGGRGIQISAQWSLDFKYFWRDMEATWFPGGTIDRIDNDGHYNRLNCRWATRKEQVKARWKESMLQNWISVTKGKIRTSKRPWS